MAILVFSLCLILRSRDTRNKRPEGEVVMKISVAHSFSQRQVFVMEQWIKICICWFILKRALLFRFVIAIIERRFVNLTRFR